MIVIQHFVRATANRMGTLNIVYSMVGSLPTVWMEVGNPGHRFAIQHFEVQTTTNPMGYYISFGIRLSRGHIAVANLRYPN